MGDFVWLMDWGNIDSGAWYTTKTLYNHFFTKCPIFVHIAPLFFWLIAYWLILRRNYSYLLM